MLTRWIGWRARLFLRCFSGGRLAMVLCCRGCRRPSWQRAYQMRQRGSCWRRPSVGIDSVNDACHCKRPTRCGDEVSIYCLLAASKCKSRLVAVGMCGRVSTLAAAGRHVRCGRLEAPGPWLHRGGSIGSEHQCKHGVAQNPASALLVLAVATAGWCYHGVEVRLVAIGGNWLVR
jgi:hypothetical protein